MNGLTFALDMLPQKVCFVSMSEVFHCSGLYFSLEKLLLLDVLR